MALFQVRDACASCYVDAALEYKNDLDARMLPLRNTGLRPGRFQFAQIMQAYEEAFTNHVDWMDSGNG